MRKVRVMKKAGKFDDGAQAVSTSHSTPHQKTLPAGLGKEKAEGMGKVCRIGAKRKK